MPTLEPNESRYLAHRVGYYYIFCYAISCYCTVLCNCIDTTIYPIVPYVQRTCGTRYALAIAVPVVDPGQGGLVGVAWWGGVGWHDSCSSKTRARSGGGSDGSLTRI